MKTDAELMSFFGVEEGKEYIVVRQFYDQEFKINYKRGSCFMIQKDTEGKYLVVFEDGVTNQLMVLQKLDYTVFSNPLTEEEQQFLKNIIKPLLKSYDMQICKHSLTGGEWIEIDYTSKLDSGELVFPTYPVGKYYKGLEDDRYYTLQELGLTKFVKELKE